MNIEDKRKYIYNNLKYINDIKNDLFYDYILKNNLKHSLNKNGLIINLSILIDDDINSLYDIINKNEINQNIIISDNFEIYEKKICEKQKSIIEKKYKNIKLNNLDIKILTYI